MLFLGTRGHNKTFRFHTFNCSTCKSYQAFLKFEISVQCILEEASDFLSSTLIIDKGHAGSAQDSYGGRRHFLTSLKRLVTERAIHREQSTLAVIEDLTTSRRIFQRQQWIKRALENIPSQYRSCFLEIATHSISVFQNCEPCHRCSGICPTGALRLVREGERKKISFNRESCSGCGLCASFCTTNALALKRANLLE